MSDTAHILGITQDTSDIRRILHITLGYGGYGTYPGYHRILGVDSCEYKERASFSISLSSLYSPLDSLGSQ